MGTQQVSIKLSLELHNHNIGIVDDINYLYQSNISNLISRKMHFSPVFCSTHNLFNVPVLLEKYKQCIQWMSLFAQHALIVSMIT